MAMNNTSARLSLTVQCSHFPGTCFYFSVSFCLATPPCPRKIWFWRRFHQHWTAGTFSFSKQLDYRGSLQEGVSSRWECWIANFWLQDFKYFLGPRSISLVFCHVRMDRCWDTNIMAIPHDPFLFCLLALYSLRGQLKRNHVNFCCIMVL